MGFFKKLIHYLVSNPQIYDLVQFTVGVKQVQKHLAKQIPRLSANSIVVDIGGGTGIERSHFASNVPYICLDIDKQKIDGYVAKFGTKNALQGDGAKLPLQDQSVDLAMMVFVTHHLTNDQLDLLIEESARVIKRTGTCLYVDPVWNPRRPLGGLLWKYDRGSHPRSYSALDILLRQRFTHVDVDRFAIFHEYAIFSCKFG